jgi:hypothetical protein
MLISYPILTAAAVHDDEDVYLGNFTESHLIAHEGRYPVSTLNTAQGPMHRWHGGVHLFGGGEPIRAIADGTVVAYRFAAAQETYAGQGDYDTSFVLLRHETQTGENTTVVFYSLYMHLAHRAALAPDRFRQLPEWLRRATPGPGVQRPQDQRVWRKEVLGFAGRLYGVEAMHFEVFMLDADFNRVWRDSTQVTQGTGSNDWFGDAHFVIPERQQFQERHHDGGVSGAHGISFSRTERYSLPLGQTGQNAERLYVSVKLQHGRRIATTYRAGAQGLYEQVGAPVVQDDYEYELYRLATALYTDCPSAGFEWLRFGRMLGTDTTTNNANWQLVRYSEAAVGYIDLAAADIAQLSDADFPHWLGWEKRDEGQTAHAADGLCDDRRTLDLVQAAQGNAAAARKLQHLVCKAPTEWDDSDLATRYARLREPGQPLQSEGSWSAFQDHVSKLAFWSQTGISDRSVWHFHPLRFIRHFRKCGWFNDVELAQCLPRQSLSAQNLAWSDAYARSQLHGLHLNKYFRKYKGESRKRHIHALAQIYIETGLLRTVEEDSRGRGHLYAAFYGRGYKQLTWAGNYRQYGTYKAIPNIASPTYVDSRITPTSQHAKDAAGTTFQWHPRYDPDIVATDLNHAAESSGMFWVSKSFRGRKNMNRVCDLPLDPASVAFNCWLVNGGNAGYANRQQFAKYLENVLFDYPTRTSAEILRYPPLTPPGNPSLCASFPPINIPFTASVTVHYVRQIP